MTPCRALLPLLAILMFPGTGGLRAQTRLGVAFYDTDHIYDTVPALFYNDEKYTPDGELHWTAARYDRKIAAIASVIDSLGMPLVGLAGVENEQVVRDLAARCTAPYCYLHRTLNTLDGLDFALLYYGDLFYPHYAEPGRHYLYIEGTMGRDTVGLVLSADTRMSEWVVRDLRAERPGAKLLVLGRSASLEPARYGLRDATARAARAGRGTVRSRGRWVMRDRILADTAFTVVGGDVFARRYLLDPRSGSPTATYSRRVYTGGYGYSLPVFVHIR